MFFNNSLRGATQIQKQIFIDLTIFSKSTSISKCCAPVLAP